MAFFTAMFTAAATAIGFAAGTAATIGAVAAFATRTLLTIGISKLIANRAGGKATGAQDAGARVQLPPATDNKLPVVYGSAYVSPTITDAKISTDQTTMWYVCALAEVTDTTVGSAYTYGNIYYDGRLVTFDGTDPAKVISLTNNSVTPSQVDTKVNGNLYIYLFTNGSSSGVNTGGQSAITILQNSAIAAGDRWTATDLMSNCAFAIVKVIYNQDAGTTNLGSLTTQLTNSLYQPGSVIKDYLLNTRYGCAIPLSKIDTASLTALDTYSAATITYTPVGGGSATQARYRIDGPINTGIDCLTNLQTMVDACDSWLQYSELTGQWKVVINQSYTDYTTLGALYSVDSSNLIGGIEVNPIDLNGTYNQIEVQYPNANIRDQTDFQFLDLFTLSPSLISPNEAINKLNLQLPIVNNAVQAKYIGLRRLYQGREDLVITFATDYSGIQVEAGDVIKVTLSNYNWTNKLFRVSNVAEEKYADGSLGARITAFEYNDSIYADGNIQDFVPNPNSGGTTDPNNIGTPAAPTVVVGTANTVNMMTITGTVPTPGSVLFIDFNYGNTNVSANHTFYTSVSSANGAPFTAGANVSTTVTNLPAGNIYWSVTARNQSVGVRGPSSTVANWPGANVTIWDGNSNSGGITNNNIANSTIANYKLANSGVTAGTYYNTTLTVTKEGLLTFAANGPNVTTQTDFGGQNFSIRSYPTPVLPVNVTSTSTRNIPVYIIGTGLDENNAYPWYQGTSNISPGNTGNNYYSAASTGSFTPSLAARLAIDDGDDSWYSILVDSSMSGNFSSANSTYVQNYGFTVVSDTNGAILQIVEGIELSSAGYFQCETDQMQNFVVFKDMPSSYTKLKTYSYPPNGSPNVTNITRSAVFVRNVTDGANIIIIQGTLASSEQFVFP
jgi:hypothetical protein